MDEKIAFFSDLKPTSIASTGEGIRPLNAFLKFLYQYNTSALINETKYFDVHFHTADHKQISGFLLLFFSVDHVVKSKTTDAEFVDIEAEIDSIDEDDYENITDLDSNSNLKLYYQYGKISDDIFVRPVLNKLSVLPKKLIDSFKQHDLLNFIFELIVKSIWTDSEVFKNEYRNNILFIVFIYLSKHIDFSFNNRYDSFISWLSLHGIQWFESESDSQSLHTKEVYCQLVTYSINLSYHIVKILLGSNIQCFTISPPEELVYFFAERTDLRAAQHPNTDENNFNEEDDENFSDEFTNDYNNVDNKNKFPEAKRDAYTLIGLDIEDSESQNTSKEIIAEDFNYLVRRSELYELSKILDAEVIDVPVMSLNQAWNLIQDKWQFYLKTFSSRYFDLSDFVRSAIFNQLKSLKSNIFSNWFDLKSGTAQNLYIDVVAYDTFKIEFLTYEAKHIQTFMKDRLKNKLSFEILAPQPKFLKNLGIFNDTYEKKIINKIRNDELVHKANGILDGITKDLLNSINLQLSNDIYLVNYFSQIDRDLEPPNYQLLDTLLRISILNLLMITSDVSLSDVKKIIKSLIDPDIEYSAFDTFDKKQYQNQLIKELSTSFRCRIDPADLLNLKP